METEFNKNIENQLNEFEKRQNINLQTNKVIEQRPRSSGFKSFLNWFKKIENLQKETEEENSTISSSSDESNDDSSTSSSTATVASFAFLPANIYKPYGDACMPEKFIASGPYTETYNRLIVERNRRRRLDKNLSLRKKYSLYSSGTINSKKDFSLNIPKSEDQMESSGNLQSYDTFSLPAIKKRTDNMNDTKDNRRTASLSSKDSKTSNSCHVKGKRKAPPPPINNVEFVKTYRKKRQAPPPPAEHFLIDTKNNEEAKINKNIYNHKGDSNNIKQQSVKTYIFEDLTKTSDEANKANERFPRPWYKRQISENKSKVKNEKNDSDKKKKHEYPEISFFRYSRIFENRKLNNITSDNSDPNNKSEKRISCLLPNISELDREAAEIIKHKKDLENQKGSENIFSDINNVSKPSSARDLINKFNAITNNAANANTKNFLVKNNGETSNTKSPVNMKSRKNIIFEKDVKAQSSVIPVQDIKSNATKTSLSETKYCKTCSKENTTTGNNCIKCIDLQLNAVQQPIASIINDTTNSFQVEVFSAIPNFNYSQDKLLTNLKNTSNENQKMNNETEEKIKLREMLKEMKNSLPKRPKPSCVKAPNVATVTVHDNVPSIQNEIKISMNSKHELQVLISDATKIEENITNNESKKYEVTNTKLDSQTEQKSIYKEKKPIQEPLRLREITNKVNSSAQTNCIIRKSDQLLDINTTNNLKLNNNLGDNDVRPYTCDKLYINIEESKTPVLKTNNAEQVNNGNTKIILKQLEAAIAQGDDLLAAKLAKDLALLRVNCSVTSANTIHSKEINKKSIQIYIEDQFSHQGPISLRVDETITMEQLKKQVFTELHIPIAVQRWIVGKHLTNDDSLTLAHYNDNNFDSDLFLYVVIPESKPEKTNNITEIISTKTETAHAETYVTKADPQNLNKIQQKWCEVINVKKCEVSENDVKKNISDTNSSNNNEVIAGPSKTQIIHENPALKNVSKKTWICSSCTLINSLLSPLCSACGSKKSDKKDNQISENQPANISQNKKDHYLQLVNLDNTDLVQNVDKFECPVCLTECNPYSGVVLRECLHSFCKDCLANLVKFSEEAEIKCPYRDRKYFCDSVIQEREIKSLVDKQMYEQHLSKSVNLAENKIKNAFHCKSPDCVGWCIYEENVNHFNCPVCKKLNCLTCQAIHEGKNCKEHQEMINREDSTVNADGQRTKQMLEDMLNRGEAMVCPSCQVVLMKKWGCDWLKCSMCKTEICWVTRGARWGPGGKGDTSGGCQCGLNGTKCHPKCNYCH